MHMSQVLQLLTVWSYLHKQLQVPENKVYFFNTYFFTRLTENAGRKSMDYKAVERWTSKVDIFAYDYIVVPINESQYVDMKRFEDTY